jgi:hypothetical protein
MAVFVPLIVAAATHGWQPRRADAYVLPLAALVVFLLFEYNRAGPGNPCCHVRTFEGTRVEFERVAAANGIQRPTVANPDLGIVSFHKQFNVIDLGGLGSAMVSHLGPGPTLSRYLFDHAAPDMVQVHGYWSCHFVSYVTDPRFRAEYVEASSPGRQFTPCKNAAAVPSGVWVRKAILRGSGTPERALMEDLAKDPSVERVAAELRRCQAASKDSANSCTYVARSVYRVLPEFRARGDQERLETLFATSRTRDVDLFLVTGGRDGVSYRKALQALAGPGKEL